jgi:hypothetical protein
MRELIRKRFALLTAFVICSAGSAGSTETGVAPEVPGSWEYFGGDEFNGTGLDLAKWNIGQWWERTNLDIVAHEVAGGCIRLYPRLDSAGKLISRTIDTDGKFYLPNGQTYYVEFRAQLPAGPGRWPALWLFGHDDSRAPARPELDVMETGTSPPWGNGQTPVAIKATSWTDEGMDRSTHKPLHQRGQHSPPRTVENLTSQFHTFGAMVDPRAQTVAYYVDGEEFAQHVLDSTRAHLYLVISDQYDGSFNRSTSADPVATWKAGIPFVVDYVRVYVAK